MRVNLRYMLVAALAALRAAHAGTEQPPRDRALEIARAGLVSNIARLEDSSGREWQFLLAGGHQFHTLWTRDFGMASAGALALGQTQAVRDSLEVIFANQRADGLMPRLIDHSNAVVRMLFSEIG